MANSNQEQRDKIYNRLKEESLDASWDMLEEHHKRGALIFISADLDLFEIGTSVAMDEVETIKTQMEQKNIIKVDDELASSLSKTPSQKNFIFTIVQPYVLAQPKKSNEQ